MDFSFPLALLKKPLEWITRKLFLSAYQASDEYYWQHNGIGAYWRALGPYLEYDTHLASIFSNENMPLSYISVRARGSNHLKKVTIKFTAKGNLVSYQDTIVFCDVGEVPVIKALPSIPLKSMWVARGGIRTPYENVQIEIVELCDDDGVNLLEGRTTADSFNPTYTEILNSEFVEYWGYYWNMDEINWQKQEVKDSIYMRLLFPVDRPWRPLRVLHPRSILFWILANKFSLALIFWSRNLVYGKQIRNAIAKENSERISLAWK